MNASKKLILILIGMCFGFTGTYGQSFDYIAPGINLPNVYQPATGPSFSFSFKLKETNNQPYSGSFRTMASVNGGPAFMVDSIQASVAQNGNGNTYDIVVDSFPATTPPFIQGANGVVVWVIDDNFNPISDFDTSNVVYATQPSFMLTPTGLVNFPTNVETETDYQFRMEVTNFYDQPYSDTVYMNLWGAGNFYRLPSKKIVSFAPEERKAFDVQDFAYETPPWELGFNPARVWVDGNGAVALDTIDTSLDLSSKTVVSVDDLVEDAVTGLRNPTHGPIVIKTRADISIQQIDIYDLAGRHVLRRSDDVMVDLSESHLDDGMYWLSAQLSDGSTYRAKLLFVR